MSVNVTEIVKRVQQQLGNIEVDGIDGVATWSAIAKRLGVDTASPIGRKASPIGDELADIAESQIGTQEDSKHTNRGDAILKYQRATSLGGQGWPWCAALVDWCVEQLFAKHPEFSRRLPRPDTAAAFGLIDWGRAHGCLVFTPNGADDPQRGDIVVYTFSHTGIVADVADHEDTFHAIEGNSNVDGSRDGYAVVRHARNFGSVNRFIRLPAMGSTT